jgi:hypothetical protein
LGCGPETFAKTVTVNSGGGADHTTLTAALTVVQSAADGADVITIQNAGPFFEGQLLIDNSANAADLTIEAVAEFARLSFSTITAMEPFEFRRTDRPPSVTSLLSRLSEMRPRAPKPPFTSMKTRQPTWDSRSLWTIS